MRLGIESIIAGLLLLEAKDDWLLLRNEEFEERSGVEGAKGPPPPHVSPAAVELGGGAGGTFCSRNCRNLCCSTSSMRLNISGTFRMPNTDSSSPVHTIGTGLLLGARGERRACAILFLFGVVKVLARRSARLEVCPCLERNPREESLRFAGETMLFVDPPIASLPSCVGEPIDEERIDFSPPQIPRGESALTDSPSESVV